MSDYVPGTIFRSITLFIIFILLSLIYSPSVFAQAKWQEDGWLKTSLAQERLANGDEFGCYGIEGLSWKLDPGAVAGECRIYIEERVKANRWGDWPISTYTPDTLTESQHHIIAEQGFLIHGDQTGIDSSAWHTVNDTPHDLWDWHNLGRRGGSLEQIIGSKQQVKAAVEEGGLVNLYWIGRVDDATIRHDGDIEQYISEEADAWLTTWGQAWSYWSASKCYQIDHSITQENDQYILSFESLISEACLNLHPERWNLPLTWIIDVKDSEVYSVISQLSGEFENISERRHTQEGFSHNNGQYLHLSIINANRVNISLSTGDYDILGMSEFWNNHSASITIAAHETTDLFKWSKRFVDQENLVFTWLVQPRPSEGEAPWIPYVAFCIGGGVIITMLVILKNEGLGPLARGQQSQDPELAESE